MIGLQGAIRIAPKMGVMVSQSRSVVSGVPRSRLSKLEKAVLATFLATSICVIPAYVLVNLKHYNGRE